MRDVGHQECAHLVRHLPELVEVERAGIGAPPRHDHLGPVLLRQPPHLRHVDLFGLRFHAVRDHLKEPAREVDRTPVGQVTAVGQIQAKNRVPVLQQGKVGRHVGLGPRMRLHVDVIGAEELLGPFDGQRLGHVDEFTAPVVTFPGVSFRILVRERGPHGLQDRLADEVLRGDQFQLRSLPLRFQSDDLGNVRIRIDEALHGCSPPRAVRVCRAR